MLPNILTISRIALTPLFIILLFSDKPYSKIYALLIFIIAAITDAYDGHLARKYNQVTIEGQFLDPLADKILVLSSFISFAYLGVIEFWMVGLIAFRDIFVTGIRLAMNRNGISMETSHVAKLKTVFQITFIIITLIVLSLDSLTFNIAKSIVSLFYDYNLFYVLMIFVVGISLYTGIHYLIKNKVQILRFLAN